MLVEPAREGRFQANSLAEPPPGESVDDAGLAGGTSVLIDLLVDSVKSASRAEPSLTELLRSSLRRADNQYGGRNDLNEVLEHTIAKIDHLLSDQINRILHHPRFQRLEASWRGLRYLVERTEPEEGVEIRVLSVSWAELARDADNALEFDGSILFRKIYEDEFGMPGGQPFGLLVGDYEIRPQFGADHPIDDVSVLTSIAGVAAAAFTPFIASAHPSLLGLSNFGELERPLDLSRAYESVEYLRWRTFRKSEDARFVGLTLPRILMRLPYEDRPEDRTPFAFQEDVAAPLAADYLWGNAAYAFASVVVRSFIESRWLIDIRGVRRGEEAGGLVTHLPVHSFETDAHGVATKFSTDVAITDLLDRTLSDLGLIPLCPCKDTEYAAFYSNRSIQETKTYTEQSATTNAKISGMLQYILCASRIAHYLKAMVRDKIGSFNESRELADMLERWLHKLTGGDDDASPRTKAEYPLREFSVNVRPIPGKPGAYFCEMMLRPHSQSDELAVGLKLVTQMSPASPG